MIRGGISAKNINVKLGNKPILNNLTISSTAGEMVGFIGPNGAGKTTLLRVLAGLQSIDSGCVLLDNQIMNTIDPKKIARYLAYLPANSYCHWSLTAEQVVSLGRLPYLGIKGNDSKTDKLAVESALKLAEVSEFSSRKINTLSSGERARVMIARTLAQEPKYLLADEPTASLDLYYQLQILNLLKKQSYLGSTIILVMHDLSLAAKFCDKLALISSGTLVAYGKPEEVLNKELIRDVYNVELEFSNDSQYEYKISIPIS